MNETPPTPSEAVAWLREIAGGRWPTANATFDAAPVLVAEIDRLQAAFDRSFLTSADRALQRMNEERWAKP